jgi:hypothetical protein
MLSNASSSASVVAARAIAAPEINAVLTMFGEVHHDERGYVNGTDICKAAGSTAQSYLSVASNSLFVATLAEELGLSMKDLMIPGRGGGNPRPAMWHPEVAMDFARWRDPRLAVQLSGILHRYFSGRLTTEDSVSAHKVIFVLVVSHTCDAWG